MTARYVTQATVFWVGLVAVGSMVVVHARHGGRAWLRAAAALNAAFGCILVVLYLGANWASWNIAIVSDAHTECLRRYPETHDASCLRSLHPVFEPDAPDDAMKEAIFRRIDALHAHRLAVFAEDPRRP